MSLLRNIQIVPTPKIVADDSDKVDGADATATPTANAIPIAGADGKLASGWLPYSDSFGTNGYTKLPNGLIIQWGKSTVNVSEAEWVYNISVTFPVQFPNEVFHINMFRDNHNTADIGVKDRRLHDITISSFQYDFEVVSLGTTGTVNWYWMAIGY